MGYWWSFHECFKVVLMMFPRCLEGIECFSMFFCFFWGGGLKCFMIFSMLIQKRFNGVSSCFNEVSMEY